MPATIAFVGDGSTPSTASRCKSIARAIPAHDVFAYGGDVYASGTTAEYTGANGFNDIYGDNALNVSPQGQNLLAKMAHTPGNHEYVTVNATTLKIDSHDAYWTGGTPARNASNYVAIDNTKVDPNAAYAGLTSAAAQTRAAAQWAHLHHLDIQGWRLLFIDAGRSGLDEGAFPTAGDYFDAVQALVNGAAHRKLIVFTHFARWSSGISHTDADQVNLDPLWQMVAPTAIAYLAGHNHHYERQFARTADGSVASQQTRGCVPITCGAAGTGLNGFVGSYATPAALAYSDATKFGFVKLTLNADSAVVDWYAMGTDGLGTPTIENTVTLNSVPAPQNIAVTNATAGGGILNWSATKTQAWASLVPASGLSPGTIAVHVDPAGLAAGTYNDTVTVISPETTNDPLDVSVQLVVTSTGAVFKVGSDSFGLVEVVQTVGLGGVNDAFVVSEGAPRVDLNASDALTLSEALSNTVSLVRADGLTLTDAVTATTVGFDRLDAFAIIDTAQLSAQFAVADAFALSEATSVAAQLSRADGLSLSEAAALVVQFASSDAFSVSEMLSGSAQVAATDAFALGGEVASLGGSSTTFIAASDTFSASEAAGLIVNLAATESYSFSEAAGAVVAQLSRSDAASLAEAAALVVNYSVGDVFTLSDLALAPAVGVQGSDAAGFADSSSVAVARLSSDAFGLSESMTLLAQASRTDNASLAEAMGLSGLVVGSDPFTLSDAASLAAGVFKAASDAFALTDTALTPNVGITASDAFTLSESLSLAATIAASDNIALSELLLISASLLASDTLTVADFANLSTDVRVLVLNALVGATVTIAGMSSAEQAASGAASAGIV